MLYTLKAYYFCRRLAWLSQKLSVCATLAFRKANLGAGAIATAGKSRGVARIAERRTYASKRHGRDWVCRLVRPARRFFWRLWATTLGLQRNEAQRACYRLSFLSILEVGDVRVTGGWNKTRKTPFCRIVVTKKSHLQMVGVHSLR